MLAGPDLSALYLTAMEKTEKMLFNGGVQATYEDHEEIAAAYSRLTRAIWYAADGARTISWAVTPAQGSPFTMKATLRYLPNGDPSYPNEIVKTLERL